MPTTVQFGDLGEIDFPDTMTQDQIEKVLREKGSSIRETFLDKRLGPVKDELGIGEEVRGVGRAFLRGIHRRIQQSDIGAIRELSDFQNQLNSAKEELTQFDSQFPNANASNNPAGFRWRQDQLGKIGTLENEISRRQKIAPALAESLGSNQAAIEALPPTRAEAEFQRPETSPLTVFKNPIELALTTSAESLPSMAPAIAGSVLGPVGTATGAGTGSFGAESSARVINAMQTAGVDLKDPDAVLAWFSDRAKSDPAIAKADLAALGPATFDALTAGFAGKFLKPALGKGALPVAKATAKEIGMQMAGGGLGSIAASKISGEPIDWKDVTLEILAEVAPVEAVSNIREEIARNLEVSNAERIRSNQEKLPGERLQPQAIEGNRGANMEQAAPQQPQPVAQRTEEEIQTPPQPDVAPVVFHSVFAAPGVTPVAYYTATAPIKTSADKGVYEAGKNVTADILEKSGFAIPPEESAKAADAIEAATFESPLPEEVQVTLNARNSNTGEPLSITMPARVAERRLRKSQSILEQLIACMAG